MQAGKVDKLPLVWQVSENMKLTSLLLAMLTGCVLYPAIGHPQPAVPLDPTVKDFHFQFVPQMNNHFALDLYAQVAKERTGQNLFFSPYSIVSALTITAEGARSETALQMGTVLRFPEQVRRSDDASIPWDTASVHREMATLKRLLLDEESAYEINIANSLWLEQTYPFRPQFLAILTEAYGAAARQVDFIRNADPTRLQINQWVEEQTKNKIKDLLAPGTIDVDTRFVLANAIYFKGNWTDEFDESETQPEDFTLLDGSSVQVPLMSQRSLRTHYAELRPDGTLNTPVLNEDLSSFDRPPNPDGFQILELEYRGRDLAMAILLPKTHTGLPALEKALSADTLTQWLDTAKRQEVHVFLPKFKLEENISLKQTLSAMGMSKAFEPNGFLGMSAAADAWKLYLSHVVHKAYVDVNEEGTEAAAATAAVARMLSARSPAIPIFRADRPFLFLIRDKRTGTMLFLGRMMRPPNLSARG